VRGGRPLSRHVELATGGRGGRGPPTRGRNSGALVIRDHPSSPSCGRKRKSSKKEAAAANQLTEEEAKRAEDAAVAKAITRSLNDLVPADNAFPINAALDWSRSAARPGCRAATRHPCRRTGRGNERRAQARRADQARGEKR
jgi:hypothetical protein